MNGEESNCCSIEDKNSVNDKSSCNESAAISSEEAISKSSALTTEKCFETDVDGAIIGPGCSSDDAIRNLNGTEDVSCTITDNEENMNSEGIECSNEVVNKYTVVDPVESDPEANTLHFGLIPDVVGSSAGNLSENVIRDSASKVTLKRKSDSLALISNYDISSDSENEMVTTAFTKPQDPVEIDSDSDSDSGSVFNM